MNTPGHPVAALMVAVVTLLILLAESAIPYIWPAAETRSRSSRKGVRAGPKPR